MRLWMSGLDYRRAPVALRERLSFSKSGVMDIERRVCRMPGVEGAVLLSTCNRTELYLSCGEERNPGRLLCQAAGVEYEDFAGAFVTRQGEDCARHLLEVACGLQSQVLGEDQILTQVKTAAALAREAGTTAPVLETLFRTAAACGKTAKSGGRLTRVPVSAAHQAVKAAEAQLGSLEGKRALVIGNGEMGRLSASLLRQALCQVTVTLRAYRHGETVIPAGCQAVAYENRYRAMEGTDILISATASPHYTVNREALAAVADGPRLLVDLALPRDIQPEIGEMPGITLLNVDNLGQSGSADAAGLERVYGQVEAHLAHFLQWSAYRASIPAQREVKEAVWERVKYYVNQQSDPAAAARLAAEKTVELLAGGLKEHLQPEDWLNCADKIRAHTR